MARYLVNGISKINEAQIASSNNGMNVDQRSRVFSAVGQRSRVLSSVAMRSRVMRAQ